MNKYIKDTAYIAIIVTIVIGMTVSKNNAIQDQRELFYQTMSAADVLDEHYANKQDPVEAVANYFEYFNNANKEALNEHSDSPFIFIGEADFITPYSTAVTFCASLALTSVGEVLEQEYIKIIGIINRNFIILLSQSLCFY